MPSGALKRWVLGARHLPQGVYGNDLASASGTSRPVDRYGHLSGRPVWSGERFLTAMNGPSCCRPECRVQDSKRPAISGQVRSDRAARSCAGQRLLVWAGNRPKPVCRVAPKRPDGEPSIFLFRFYGAAARDLTRGHELPSPSDCCGVSLSRQCRRRTRRDQRADHLGETPPITRSPMECHALVACGAEKSNCCLLMAKPCRSGAGSRRSALGLPMRCASKLRGTGDCTRTGARCVP